jgi:hypothetical protein
MPDVHGAWIGNEHGYVCSVCECFLDGYYIGEEDLKDYDTCPKCGAMMDEREKLIALLDEVHHKPLGKTYRERIETIADHLIANGVRLESKQATSDKASEENKRWIPVTERLPEKWQNVLTVSKNGSIDFDYICSSGGWYGDLENQQNPVTHWMPLPEPPKEGE